MPIELEGPGGRIRCSIDLEHGGRLASLFVDGLSLLVPRSAELSAVEWGSYAMVPWAGRVRDARFAFESRTVSLPANDGPHALHGTCFGAIWTMRERTESCARLEIALPGPWPFGGTAWQQIELREDGIALELGVTAPDDRAMPVSLGWHPWFRRRLERGGELELDVDLTAARLYARDADGLPTGELVPPPDGPWDDCFTGAGAIALRWPGALALRFEHDCANVVLYTEPAHAVCVEPQTGPPDAFTLDPAGARVEAGGSRIARASLRVAAR